MASYEITQSTTEADEGDTITFTVSTTDHDTTDLYWTILGTNITSSDFSPSGLSGTLTSVPATGTVTFSKTLSNDLSFEGYEIFIVQLRINSTSGEVVAVSSNITVIDTSSGVTPDPNQGMIKVSSANGFVYRSSGTWYKITGTPVSL